MYGRHHFSMSSWGYQDLAFKSSKKPSWFTELHKRPAVPDLEAVVWGLNCSNAAMIYFKGTSSVRDPTINFYFLSRLPYMLWYVFAAFVASISSIMYVVIQSFHRFLRFGSHAVFLTMLQKAFPHTWNNLHIRSCQFLYWPIFLLGTGFRVQANVEYAHMTALRKHSIWSSIVIDIIMGVVFGMVILVNIRQVFFGTLSVASDITNNLLRSGCVWLMGVPAGFKLNTELAELLGMVSLNAIQIFSTFWFLFGSLFWPFVKGLALSGMFLGLTVPAALCIDMLKIATFHVQALHRLISFLYSRQIQALASLWRLFRGRKWNPLRRRLDSYNYTVEQHVVGSLLFTPLLLLLPTTSVFYIFFTILNSTVCIISIVIEAVISTLHATPWAEILLWVASRRRFPSGIWFEIISRHHGLEQRELKPVISLLHSNYATIVQIVSPRYKNLFERLSPSFHGLSAYGVLSGQRIPSTLEIKLQPTLPWMRISCKEYWRLCYDSIVACRSR